MALQEAAEALRWSETQVTTGPQSSTPSSPPLHPDSVAVRDPCTTLGKEMYARVSAETRMKTKMTPVVMMRPQRRPPDGLEAEAESERKGYGGLP